MTPTSRRAPPPLHVLDTFFLDANSSFLDTLSTSLATSFSVLDTLSLLETRTSCIQEDTPVAPRSPPSETRDHAGTSDPAGPAGKSAPDEEQTPLGGVKSRGGGLLRQLQRCSDHFTIWNIPCRVKTEPLLCRVKGCSEIV